MRGYHQDVCGRDDPRASRSHEIAREGKRPWHGSLDRTTYWLAAVAIAALLCGSAPAAHAAPITYDLVGVSTSDNKSNGQHLYLTGSFVFDPTTSSLISTDITATDPNDPTGDPVVTGGIYNQPILVAQNNWGPGFDAADVLVIGNADNTDSISLPFQTPLVDAAQLIPEISKGGEIYTSASGSAVPRPAPEPASLLLLGAGLGALGWVRRRKRKS